MTEANWVCGLVNMEQAQLIVEKVDQVTAGSKFHRKLVRKIDINLNM